MCSLSPTNEYLKKSHQKKKILLVHKIRNGSNRSRTTVVRNYHKIVLTIVMNPIQTLERGKKQVLSNNDKCNMT